MQGVIRIQDLASGRQIAEIDQMDPGAHCSIMAAIKGFSRFWDIYLPLGISVIPAGCFKLLRLAADGLDRPGAGIATWQIVVMIALQTTGIVAMAVVMLIRLEIGMMQLRALCGENPIFWRRLSMLLSMGFLTLFDIFLNVGFGFDGAFPLTAVAAFFFLLYVLGIRLSFCGLSEHH